MKRVLVALALMCLAVGSAHAEMTTKAFLDEYNGATTENDQFLWKLYLNGLYQGMGWTNSAVKQSGGKPLFCEPPKQSMTVERAFSILSGYARGNPKSGEYPVALSLLLALKDTYPC